MFSAQKLKKNDVDAKILKFLLKFRKIKKYAKRFFCCRKIVKMRIFLILKLMIN